MIWVRSLTAADAPDVYAIEQLCFPTPWSLQSIEKDLGANPLAHLVGAFWEDQLVGYAGMWQVVDEAHITNIAVLPGYRGRGIGRMLLEALLKDANVRGARSATLEVRPSNIAALALYQSQGFVIQGRRKQYYTDNGEDALILWKYFSAQENL